MSKIKDEQRTREIFVLVFSLHIQPSNFASRDFGDEQGVDRVLRKTDQPDRVEYVIEMADGREPTNEDMAKIFELYKPQIQSFLTDRGNEWKSPHDKELEIDWSAFHESPKEHLHPSDIAAMYLNPGIAYRPVGSSNIRLGSMGIWYELPKGYKRWGAQRKFQEDQRKREVTAWLRSGTYAVHFGMRLTRRQLTEQVHVLHLEPDVGTTEQESKGD